MAYNAAYPNQRAAHHPRILNNIANGMNISPGITGDTFIYHGNSIGLQGRMDSISNTDT